MNLKSEGQAPRFSEADWQAVDRYVAGTVDWARVATVDRWVLFHGLVGAAIRIAADDLVLRPGLAPAYAEAVNRLAADVEQASKTPPPVGH